GGLINGSPKRVERWERIAEEAAQQSRRLAAPVVEPPHTLTEALGRPTDLRCFIDFAGEEPPPALLAGLNPASTVGVFVGPEGGWSDDELALARDMGAQAISLGPNVLRAETAALAAVSILGLLLRTIK